MKFILIFFIVVYLLGYLGKIFLGRWVKKMSNQNSQFESQNAKKEGEVTINTDPNTKKGFSKNDGDYVDYEEVNE